MKRFFSIMLVAMLLVGSLATVAFAAEEKTGSVTFTVTGNFANFSGQVNVTPGLEITAITGVVGNPANGVIGYSDAGNADRNITFTVSYKLPAGAACGTYSISASVVAKKAVYKDDGTPNGTVETDSTLSGGGSVTVDHTWGDWTQTKAPTCTEKGEETRECSVCGEKQTRALDMVAHKWGEWKQTKAPTCVEKGEETRTCSVCGEKETRALDLVAHKWSDWKVTKEATCKAEGSRERVCSVCGEKQTEKIDKLAHDWSDWEAIPGGEYHAHICRVCHEYADKEPHAFEWVIDKKPGANHTGEKHEECHKCGYKRNQGTEIPAVPDLDDVPQTGDITPYIAMGFLSMIGMMAAAVYVIKRKFAK